MMNRKMFGCERYQYNSVRALINIRLYVLTSSAGLRVPQIRAQKVVGLISTSQSEQIDDKLLRNAFQLPFSAKTIVFFHNHFP